MNLSLRGISMSFANKKVLDNISIDVAAGEFVSLIGPSGSGKSTLFNIIGGLLTPNSGEVSMNDQSIINEVGLY